jgi:hypothetical protein
MTNLATYKMLMLGTCAYIEGQYAGVIRLIFLIGHLHLIGVWLGEDQNNKHRKEPCFRETGLRFHLLLTTLDLIANVIGRLCVQSKNQQTCTSDNHK